MRYLLAWNSHGMDILSEQIGIREGLKQIKLGLLAEPRLIFLTATLKT